MHRLIRLAFVALGMLTTLPAQAQPYPNKPIRIVVPYPPGGPPDFIGRLYGHRLTEMLGQPVVVENRVGANGNIAAQLVAKSANDGSTFLIHASSIVINPLLYKSVGYDPFTDFTPVSLLFDYKLIVIVHPAFAVQSLQELVAAAKARPGSIAYASAGGVGAPTHLAVEMFKQVAGIDLTHIPYAGGAPAVNDLLAGHVQMMFFNPTQSLPHLKAGKLRALATTGATRMPFLPDQPTVIELGYPGFDVGTWFGLWGPAGVSPAIVTTINAAIGKIAVMDDVREQLSAQGLNNLAGSAATLAAFQKSEQERWSKVIKAANITAE